MAEWTKRRDEVTVSPLMAELRARLTEEGFIWKDASEEFGWGDYVYHMERTKVLGPEGQLASCIYGYSGKRGHETGSSYGWPDMIEGWPHGTNDPEPMTVEKIIEAVKALCPASSSAAEGVLTRKAQAIQEAIASGQDVSAAIKREQAIEQMENDRKMRLLKFAG